MVALASSKEEVIEYLKNDIYAKSEVWDFSKVSLHMFTTFRAPFRLPGHQTTTDIDSDPNLSI